MKQRTKSDCVIAALAIATGRSYREVKSTFGRLRGGLEYHEIRWILSEFGTWRETRPRKLLGLESWLRRHRSGRYVVILKSGVIDDYHAIAAVDGRLIGEYADDWPVGLYFHLTS
jgi:hypothetical protein